MRKTVSGLLGSPQRNLAAVVAFMMLVIVAATMAYVRAGWGWSDAFYMVILTVYTVGYREVRPVDTPALRLLTEATIAFGCTGMILLTGVLVQVFTVGQITQMLGIRRVTNEIDKLNQHTIICGFGRIGVMLAKDLKDGGSQFLIVDRDEARVAQAQAMGFLALAANASEEEGLKAAGIKRARVLATVLPDDSANVFVTLNARSLNSSLQIIARGEQPSTESKLLYAGANMVVLPTHIGAERIAELILFPQTAGFILGSERMRDFDQTLRGMGLNLEMVIVTDRSPAIGSSIAQMEQRGGGSFFIVQLERRSGATLPRPAPETLIEAGDGVLMVTRVDIAAVTAMFQGKA